MRTHQRAKFARLVARLVLAGGVASPAVAAPTILKTGDPDHQGVSLYRIGCDGGAGSLVQCRRDEQHCGYLFDEPVETVAARSCEKATTKLEAAPPPADVSPGLDTSAPPTTAP